MKVFQPIAEVAANALMFAKMLPEPILALIGILGSLASIRATVAGTFMLQAAAGIYFIKSMRESVIIPHSLHGCASPLRALRSVYNGSGNSQLLASPKTQSAA